MNALSLETVGMTMRFGSFTALNDVSIRVKAGSFHALLGENGAGKSTLVKCIMGFYHQTDGQLMVDDREVTVNSPRDAAALGLGMVYQHFTLVPSMTGAENLVISRNDVARIIDWRRERAELAEFMRTMPFPIPLDRPVRELSAGEKQKLEIIRQLYLGRRLLILDEPTSVRRRSATGRTSSRRPVCRPSPLRSRRCSTATGATTSTWRTSTARHPARP